jgi:hypothetical protein
MKDWVLGVITTALSLWLIVTGSSYPCLRGAGLALADFEAFMLLVLVAVPCFGWATRRLVIDSRAKSFSGIAAKIINRLALLTVCAVAVYVFLAVPVIFSVSRHPLQFICR